MLQEHPAFLLFSKGEQGGAAQVRSILNRAVGAEQDAVKQVSHLTLSITHSIVGVVYYCASLQHLS